jgi:hypothetical protein
MIRKSRERLCFFLVVNISTEDPTLLAYSIEKAESLLLWLGFLL